MKLLNFLCKFFKKDNTLKIGQQTEKHMKNFDIEIIEFDDNGKQITRVENGVSADSKDELIELYRNCGQKIRILKTYDDDNNIVQPPKNTKLPAINAPSKQPTYVKVQQPKEVKYFNICGTDCKLEDGKIYQKQWVKILGNEISQYRLISDSNNKEISMNGKHLEMLKWILVQEENNEVTNSIQQILNG